MLTSRIRSFNLWNGKEVVGQVCLIPPLVGKAIVLSFAPSILKQEYNRTYESITVPITYRCLSDDGVTYTVERCLDVRRKSKRQIELLKTYDCGFI